VGVTDDLGLKQLRSRLPSPVRALRARSFPLRAPTLPGGVAPLPDPQRTGVDFDTNWSRCCSARMLRAGFVEGPMRLMVQLLASPRRLGSDRLADVEGAVIFASNHHSHLDTPLLLTSLPEPWRHKVVVGAAADYFFATRAVSTMSALLIGAIPIERAKVGRRSADLAANLIDEGWSLLIYPEGGRSPDGWGQPFRGGAAYLALRCKVPVVPIHLSGTGEILRKGRRLPRPSQARVTFGSPLAPEPEERAHRFATRIEAAVAALADEAATDWYAARKRAHSGSSGAMTGPDAGVWRRKWALGDKSNQPSLLSARRWPDL